MELIEIKEILWKASVQVDIQGHGRSHIIDSQDFEMLAQDLVKKLTIPDVSENKPMDEDYPLIPMKDIEDEARLIAVRWHENATNWIGDKHKLASDIMNYARRKSSANAR